MDVRGDLVASRRTHCLNWAVTQLDLGETIFTYTIWLLTLQYVIESHNFRRDALLQLQPTLKSHKSCHFTVCTTTV